MAWGALAIFLQLPSTFLQEARQCIAPHGFLKHARLATTSRTALSSARCHSLLSGLSRPTTYQYLGHTLSRKPQNPRGCWVICIRVCRPHCGRAVTLRSANRRQPSCTCRGARAAQLHITVALALCVQADADAQIRPLHPMCTD